jgi:hypothetical protein
MRLVSLAVAALALAVTAPAARASTAGTVLINFRLDGTCTFNVPACDVRITPTSCLERLAPLACTADPTTVRLLGAVPGSNTCPALRPDGATPLPVMTVHTAAYGDVPVSVTLVLSTHAVIAGYSARPWLDGYAVLGGVGNGYAPTLGALADPCPTSWTAQGSAVLVVVGP